jgi:hypothetical protein
MIKNNSYGGIELSHVYYYRSRFFGRSLDETVTFWPFGVSGSARRKKGGNGKNRKDVSRHTPRAAKPNPSVSVKKVGREPS